MTTRGHASEAKVTLAELAPRVGVSRAAVSAVLGQASRSTTIRVSDARAAEIRGMARRLGYQPNIHARALRGGKTRTVGILWAIGGPHAVGLTVQDLSLAVEGRGYLPYVVNSLSDIGVVSQALDDFLARSVEGVVLQWEDNVPLLPAIRERLRGFAAAVVVAGAEAEPGLDTVIHDRFGALRAVADHFATTGRRNPALVMQRLAQSSKVAPFSGQLAVHGLALPPECRIDVPLDNGNFGANCQKAVAQALDAGCRFDAVLCGNDEGAAAVLAELRRHGLAVPGDVAVVGFNDSQFGPFLVPPLASIARHDAEVVAAVERFLFSRLKDPETLPRQILVPMEFVARESAGNPKAG